MREFKFRVFYEGKMYPCSIYDDGWVTIWKDGNSIVVGCVNNGSSILKTCEPMQYTGLKDRNGVEIYEGDYLLRESGDKYTVDWSSDGASFRLRPNYTRFNIDQSKYIKVIGNIYEKPELLNNKELK